MPVKTNNTMEVMREKVRRLEEQVKDLESRLRAIEGLTMRHSVIVAVASCLAASFGAAILSQAFGG